MNNDREMQLDKDDTTGQRPDAASSIPSEKLLVEMLCEDNRRMRIAGCKLAEAALHVIYEYDGLHRLSIAVAAWAEAVAGEGGREKRYASEKRQSVLPLADGFHDNPAKE